MFSLLNLLIDANCGAVPGEWMNRPEALIPRTAATLQVGARAHIDRGPGRQFWLHREPHGVFRLTTTRDASPIPRRATIEEEGPRLWKVLEAGASTPEGRRYLAQSMLPLLPCGACRTHWGEALETLTEYDLSTDQAFDLWVWRKHNTVNERRGVAFFPYPGFRQLK